MLPSVRSVRTGRWSGMYRVFLHYQEVNTPKMLQDSAPRSWGTSMSDWLDYDYDYTTNLEVSEAIEWAEWLSSVKDPGPPLLAAKKHAATLLKAYRQMSMELSAAYNGLP